MSTELDELDRRIAEVRDGEWWLDTHLATGALSRPTAYYVATPEGEFVCWFEPTRDARQAMVLLEEMPDVALGRYKLEDAWDCTAGFDNYIPYFGATPREAICRAWIVWKEATTNK